MKQYTALALVLSLIIATPAFAAPNENANRGQEKANENKNSQTVETQDNHEVSITPSVTIEPSGTVSVTPSVTYRNHGAYVSSVAKTHPGGQVVSTAARSDIGKKKAVSPSPSVVPSVSPTETPTPTVTGEPTPTATPTATVTPTPTGEPIVTAALPNPLTGIATLLENVKTFLQNLV